MYLTPLIKRITYQMIESILMRCRIAANTTSKPVNQAYNYMFFRQGYIYYLQQVLFVNREYAVWSSQSLGRCVIGEVPAGWLYLASCMASSATPTQRQQQPLLVTSCNLTSASPVAGFDVIVSGGEREQKTSY